MNITQKIGLLAENSLFPPEQMGITFNEWEKVQLEIREKLFLKNSFFFPGNTPSLKNSKEILQIYAKNSTCCHAPILRLKSSGKLIAICSKCKKTVNLKRPILAPSKTVVEYKANYASSFLANKQRFKEELKRRSKPYLLGFYFVRDSNRTFDYGNAKHILLDMMVEFEYFEDDNADIIMDFPLGYCIDKNRPGAYVVIMDNNFLKQIIDFI